LIIDILREIICLFFGQTAPIAFFTGHRQEAGKSDAIANGMERLTNVKTQQIYWQKSINISKDLAT
jgi:hypothetical protein